jgi:hypothetical protein
VAEDRHASAIGREERREDREQRRLARAVGAEHADDRASLDRQGDPAQRGGLTAARPARAKRLLYILRVDGEHTQR